MTNGSNLSSARPLAAAVPLPLNLPAVVPVVAMSATSVGLSTGLPGVTVKPSSKNLCTDGKAETLCVVGPPPPQLSMETSHSSLQPASSSRCDTSESVAQGGANALCTPMRVELAKTKSTSASPRQVKSSGGYNLLISRKTLDSSIANTLLRMRQLPVVGRTSAPEAGGRSIAPHLLKLAPKVEQRVVWNVASSAAQASTALTTITGCSGGQTNCGVGSAAQMSRHAAVQLTKTLRSGVAGLLRSDETTCSNAELSSAVVDGACRVALESVGSAQSTVQLRGTKIRPCGTNSRGSVESGVSVAQRSHSALLPRLLGMAGGTVESCGGGGQCGSALATARGGGCVSGEREACSLSNWKCVDVEGGSSDVVASDAMMCPMCSFSSCDREAIMQHVIDAH